MRIVFMGTPAFAVPSLERLARDFEVSLVVTRPDAVRGRGRVPEPSAVKTRALALGLDVVECTRMTLEVGERIAAVAPDVIVVAAFGCIIPDDVIALARLECINVHASLLPRWRGAAPIQRAILAGDERVGVSIMRVAHDLDAGAYCRQASCEVDGKTATELFSELGILGADALGAAVEDIADGRAVWTEQDRALVTLAPKVTKAEMRLDPALSAHTNALVVQASTDAAPARACVCGRGIRVLRAAVLDSTDIGAGEVSVAHGHVVLGCAGASLELVEVKPDGKRAMDASAWAAGIRGAEGTWGRV